MSNNANTFQILHISDAFDVYLSKQISLQVFLDFGKFNIV